MKHTIKQQVLDLRMDKRLDPFVVQQAVSDHYRKDLVPVMNRLFNSLSAADTIIQLDKLEINLGTISVDMIRSGQWVVQVQQVLEQSLMECIREAGGNKGGMIQPLHSSSFDQWCFFIEHGLLPWNAGKPGKDWYDHVLETLARNYHSAARLRDLIATRPASLERIVQHHPPALLSHLVELLTAQQQHQLAQAIDELADWLHGVATKYKYRTLTPSSIRKWLWKAALRLSASRREALTTATMVGALLTEYLSLTPALLKRAFQHKPGAHQFRIIPAMLQNMPGWQDNNPRKKGKQHNTNEATATGPGITSKQDNKQETPGDRKAPRETSKEAAQKTLAPLLRDRKNEHAADQPGMEILEEGVYIPNAGVVLLHVFFHNCFKNAGLVEQGKFIDTEKQLRALYLVHYLATGNTGPAEFDLVLPKLLCNWPMQEPVETGLELTTAELEEADHLLASATRQWKSLKNTSPAGLQVNFLQRPGKLWTKNDKWYLQVETQSAIDLLLDTLPWTISMIKLPWMKELLRVEWR